MDDKLRADVLYALRISKEFMEIASDWNLDEAEIDGNMQSTYDWIDIINRTINKVKEV